MTAPLSRISRSLSVGRLAYFLERRPVVGISALTLLYLAVTVKIASRRLLWEDEFFTLYLSKVSFGETWSALLTGADQHPPLFYALTHFCLSVFGIHHVSVRLPAIAGVWLMCVCIYRFVSRRTSPVYGMTAMLVPLLTYVFFYAYEARGYGPALGFTAAAILGWQEAGNGRHRRLGLAVLALALMLAVSSHYYAGLVLIPLALGEMVQSRNARRIDWPVWLAFASPVILLAAYLPLIRSAHTYSATFWARPYWQQAFDIYEFIGINAGFPVVLLLAFFGSCLVWRASAEVQEPVERRIPQHELAMVIGLLLLPAATVALAMYVTHGFHFRYMLTPVIAISVLVSWVAFAVLRGDRTAGLCLVVIVLCGFGVNAWRSWVNCGHEVGDVAASFRFLEASTAKHLPIAVTNAARFYQLSFYAPRRLANRLVYPADPPSSVRFIGHDTIDRCLLALRPWFPLQTADYHDFTQSNPVFYAYGDFTEWTWQSWRFVQDGLNLQMLARDRSFVLLRVTRPGSPVLPGGQAPSAAPFGAHIQPLVTPSICDQWSQDRLCRLFR